MTMQVHGGPRRRGRAAHDQQSPHPPPTPMRVHSPTSVINVSPRPAIAFRSQRCLRRGILSDVVDVFLVLLHTFASVLTHF